ncbi:MAG: Hydrogen cyanide synthase subunit HcnC precursor [Acidobacteria bacterium ADurb.Bin340]|nr:MAG: Hydrogen cyanide synthase subunit HcnC precursor [Acidobacteria bacterium ADurb.Bin340]
MSTQVFDVIVVGAGSVGMPAAMSLAERGLKVLCIDQFASPGQGSNKAAIGGLRATHSAPAKIKLCLESLKTFATWEEAHGDDLEWFQGGYVFVAYRPEEARVLQDLLKVQKAAGLDIEWYGPEELLRIVPGLQREGLIGGTFSPGDGSASPMRSNLAFYRRAKELGVSFRFQERVTAIIRRKGQVVGVRTDKGGYATPLVVNAAGPWARQLAQVAGLDAPVVPDCHEAGITEPVARFLKPMVVDIQPAPGSKNYYFHQSALGQVIFCITPDPAILGSDRRETSAFLPMTAQRMVGLMPKLANLKVRRTWRGLYPMTPDGSPIVGRHPELSGYIDAIGMCGQGYMLGPGVGSLVARLATDQLTPDDRATLEELRPDRVFGGAEALK